MRCLSACAVQDSPTTTGTRRRENPPMFTLTFTTTDLAIACVCAALVYGLWLTCIDPDRSKRRAMRKRRETIRTRSRKVVAL